MLCIAFVVSLLSAFPSFAFADDPKPSTNAPTPASVAKKAYDDAQARFRTESTNSEAAWQLGKACFEWADLVGDKTSKAAVAEEGISVCRKLIIRDPTLGYGHYYLALNLGQLADTKRNAAALKMVDEMEAEFKLADGLKPEIDFAGPARGLGNLYLSAPGWPISVGSRSKARANLKRAAEKNPDFPENQLCLIEAYLQWGDKKIVQQLLPAVDKTMTDARAKFTGNEWLGAWQDWLRRWEKIKGKIAK